MAESSRLYSSRLGRFNFNGDGLLQLSIEVFDLSESAIGVRTNRATGRVRVSFFTGAATVIALIVFVAFSRTFYLRPFFVTTDLSVQLGQDGLPLHLILHGLALSVWYAFFCLQAWLVALGHVRYHRQFGYFGLVAALAVVISGAVTLIRFVPRALEVGANYSEFSGVIVGNVFSLLMFVIFVGLAIFWRYRREVHKRLMYLASVSILGPVFAGGDRPLGAFLEQVVPDPLDIGLFAMGTLAAALALVIYDLSSDRRLHPITLSCGLLVGISEFVFDVITQSAAGPALAQWVGRLA